MGSGVNVARSDLRAISSDDVPAEQRAVPLDATTIPGGKGCGLRSGTKYPAEYDDKANRVSRPSTRRLVLRCRPFSCRRLTTSRARGAKARQVEVMIPLRYPGGPEIVDNASYSGSKPQTCLGRRKSRLGSVRTNRVAIGASENFPHSTTVSARNGLTGCDKPGSRHA
jgi:hypothetical protein